MTGDVKRLNNEPLLVNPEEEIERKSKLTSSTAMNIKSRNKRISRNGDGQTASSNLFGTSQDFRVKHEPYISVTRRPRSNNDKVQVHNNLIGELLS